MAFMKLNRVGLRLCVAYVVAIILMLVLALFLFSPMWLFLAINLAYFPAAAIIGILHLLPLIEPLPY
jgi:hypothetical protein